MAMTTSHPTETTPILKPRKNEAAVYIAAGSMMSCAYNLMAIDPLLLCLNQLYALVTWEQALLASSTIVGAFVGSMAFGVCSDTYGRYKAFLWSCTALFVGATASGCCYATSTPVLITLLAFCRFVAGIGIGGQYPVIAAIVTESVSPQRAPFAVAATMSMQGIGFFMSSLCALSLLGASVPTEYVWRITLLKGGLPQVGVLCLWWQLNPEVVNSAMQESVPQRGKKAFANYSFVEIVSRHKIALTGTASTWFIMAMVYYGLASFRSELAKGFSNVGSDPHMTSNDIWNASSFSVLFAAATVPGFLLTAALIDWIGVRRLQVCGFFCMGLTCVMVAHASGRASPLLVTAALSLAFFFACFGPNPTTYILPAIYFPVAERSTCHGVCSAFGKIGAIIGAVSFPLLDETFGVTGVMYACAIVCFSGMFLTILLCPEPIVHGKDEMELAAEIESEYMANEVANL